MLRLGCPFPLVAPASAASCARAFGPSCPPPVLFPPPPPMGMTA